MHSLKNVFETLIQLRTENPHNKVIINNVDEILIEIVKENHALLPKVDFNELIGSYQTNNQSIIPYITNFAQEHSLPILVVNFLILATCKPLKNIFEQIGISALGLMESQESRVGKSYDRVEKDITDQVLTSHDLKEEILSELDKHSAVKYTKTTQDGEAISLIAQFVTQCHSFSSILNDRPIRFTIVKKTSWDKNCIAFDSFTVNPSEIEDVVRKFLVL